jgi:hypothetical protein
MINRYRSGTMRCYSALPTCFIISDAHVVAKIKALGEVA